MPNNTSYKIVLVAQSLAYLWSVLWIIVCPFPYGRYIVCLSFYDL